MKMIVMMMVMIGNEMRMRMMRAQWIVVMIEIIGNGDAVCGGG